MSLENIKNYQEPSEELKNLRAELSECQAALAERDREVAWLCEDNERLMTKQANLYGYDDDEKAKREREIQVLQFRIDQLVTEKDIVELKLNEAQQENETLRE